MGSTDTDGAHFGPGNGEGRSGYEVSVGDGDSGGGGGGDGSGSGGSGGGTPASPSISATTHHGREDAMEIINSSGGGGDASDLTAHQVRSGVHAFMCTCIHPDF